MGSQIGTAAIWLKIEIAPRPRTAGGFEQKRTVNVHNERPGNSKRSATNGPSIVLLDRFPASSDAIKAISLPFPLAGKAEL